MPIPLSQATLYVVVTALKFAANAAGLEWLLMTRSGLQFGERGAADLSRNSVRLLLDPLSS